jgi:hypothetical protein
MIGLLKANFVPKALDHFKNRQKGLDYSGNVPFHGWRIWICPPPILFRFEQDLLDKGLKRDNIHSLYGEAVSSSFY